MGKGGIMKPFYDVIIIGTGVGGTAAGAILAREGNKVLFIEKNARIGGACSYYTREGVHVDIGAHMFSRGNRGPFGEVQRRLGATQLIRFMMCDPLMRFKGPQLDITERFRLHTVPRMYASLFRQAGIHAKEIPSLLNYMATPLVASDKRVDALNSQNMQDFLESYTQNPAIFLFMSIMTGLYFVIPFWWASAGESLWCTKRAFRSLAPGYPKGGAVAVPRTFLDGARSFGAEVIENARVKHIRLQRGRAKGVETADGRFFESRAVISTTSLQDTVKLTGREHFPPSYRDHVQQIRGSMSAIQAKILLDRPVVQEGVLVGVRDRRPSQEAGFSGQDVRTMWEDTIEGRIPRLFSFYCPVPTNFDPELAPHGKQLLTITTAVQLSGHSAVDAQDKWIDAMLEALFDIYPHIKNHIVWIDRFTNRFLDRWLGKRGGPVISTCQHTGQVGRLRHPNHTPVPGLYVAGDCAGARGIGTELACQSGIECADTILQAMSNRIV